MIGQGHGAHAEFAHHAPAHLPDGLHGLVEFLGCRGGAGVQDLALRGGDHARG